MKTLHGGSTRVGSNAWRDRRESEPHTPEKSVLRNRRVARLTRRCSVPRYVLRGRRFCVVRPNGSCGAGAEDLGVNSQLRLALGSGLTYNDKRVSTAL